MKHGPLKDGFAVGIIDEDKVRLKELDTFVKVERLSKNGLKNLSSFYKETFFYSNLSCKRKMGIRRM